MPAQQTTSGSAPDLEQAILRARQIGDLSCEESFREVYDLYGREVLAWLWTRVSRDQADDLFQEIWATFFARWRRWEFRDELAVEGARPILSFLFRTAAFAWKGNRRKRRESEPVPEETADPAATAASLNTRLELGRCLDLATQICSPEEVEVLVARLSGMSGPEIAQALGISESIADHRYRGAVARLRRRLQIQKQGQEQVQS